MRNRIYIGVIFLGIIFFSLFLLSACKHYHRNRAHADIPESSIRRGEALAQVYCQSCHELPDPALLDARSWEKGVLPDMGPRLGIFAYNFKVYPSGRGDTNLRGYYPARPLLPLDEWQHILDYYTATSPDSLAPPSRPRPIKKGLSLFKAEIPSFRYDMPATCLVRVDTSAGNRGLLLFDAHYENLYRLNPALQPVDSLHIKGAIVDIGWQQEGMWACNIGMLNPNNEKFGKGQWLRTGSAGRLQLDSVPLFDRLARPVQLAAADLNQDGKTDYLVCEFGNQVGALSWMENKGGQQFERHVIRPVAGAIKAYIDDYNHDGKPDIWALFAQGDEGIILFTNEGNGKFSQRQILRFPPMYGSSYFELADFNKDGHPDILYTCGDNADFSPILKPYHGVYIYMNDGHDNFTQQYFFPINGCYKAMARDFDGDGDLDIATISFFADYTHQPEEGFVYLENLGGWDFQPYSLPEGQLGKWLTMDAADLDGDGKTDIVLGNFSFYAPVTAAGVDFKKGPPFILLKNTGGHP
jgi:hypothetical protein